jgi:hypothetical protein
MAESGEVPVAVSISDAELDSVISKLDSIIASMDRLEQSTPSGDLTAAVNDAEEKIADVMDKSTETEAGLGNLFEETKDELNGINWSMRRITSMIPGVREAYRMLQSIQRIQRFGPESIGGIVSIILLVYMMYNMVKRFLDEQKRKELDFRRETMSISGIKDREVFYSWQQQQRSAVVVRTNIGR